MSLSDTSGHEKGHERPVVTAWTLVALLAVACGGHSIGRVKGPDSACAYGNIIVDGAYHANNVIVHEIGVVYAPPFNSPPQAATFDNGTFFFDNLTPGRYYLARFMVGQDMYAFSGSSQEQLPVVFEVRPGESVFMGSFQAVSGKGSVFSPEFDFTRSPHPNEAELLRGILPSLTGTGWEERLRPKMSWLRPTRARPSIEATFL